MPSGSFTVFLEGPILITERTRLPLFQPPRYAMEVECVIAGAPGHCALFGAALLLGGLARNADLHKMVPADGAVVDVALPLPHGDCIPLFY